MPNNNVNTHEKDKAALTAYHNTIVEIDNFLTTSGKSVEECEKINTLLDLLSQKLQTIYHVR